MLEYDPPEHTRLPPARVASRSAGREVYAYEDAIRVLARDGGRRGARRATHVRLRRPRRQAAADADARSSARRARRRRPVARRAGRRAARQHRPRVHRHPVGLSRHRRVPAHPVPLAGRRSSCIATPSEQAAQRRADPTDDVITQLLGTDDRRRAAHRARVQELLHAAGGRRERHHPLHDGGRHQGADRAAATRSPQLRDCIASDRRVVAPAVEEILRWTTVTMHFRRTATHDLELRGQQIKAGDKVVIWFMLGRLRRAPVPRPVSRSTSTARRTSTSPSGG